jgi:hypothetical protein
MNNFQAQSFFGSGEGIRWSSELKFRVRVYTVHICMPYGPE